MAVLFCLVGVHKRWAGTFLLVGLACHIANFPKDSYGHWSHLRVCRIPEADHMMLQKSVLLSRSWGGTRMEKTVTNLNTIVRTDTASTGVRSSHLSAMSATLLDEELASLQYLRKMAYCWRKVDCVVINTFSVRFFHRWGTPRLGIFSRIL